MKRFFLTLLSLLLVQMSVLAQDNADLSYYLPDGITYNPDIPKPSEVIGHEVGEWHITHDKLVQYMQTLAEASDRIQIEDRGKTFEDRPVLLLKITAPENHQRLEAIRTEHLRLTESGASSLNPENMPVVVYQGFSIHGNEPSGANAGLAYAYYLAAAQGPDIERKLKEMVILMDPSFNPDGLQRFAYWANSNRSMHLNPDENDREYHEIWPGGRTNHYWFDMNRDWLPVQLPESRARIKTFHDWYPNILTDHHEMGTDATFFFQPGEPSRVHPLTPGRNQELTAEIGTYHAAALDGIGSLYYSEEDYDDYYYGKGSTFPDVNGGIGILFEQGSSRGHIQESENGILTFPFTIRNQFVTALSTIDAAWNMRTKLLDYQREFFRDMRTEKGKSSAGGIVFGDAKDGARAWHLAEILQRHRIQFYPLNSDTEIEGKKFRQGFSYVVPMNQKNPRLIRAMFEKRTTFTDSIFYDISAWTFPLAFNLDYAQTNRLPEAGATEAQLEPIQGGVDQKSNYAYLFEWHEYYTPKVLNAVLEKGLRAKVAKERFQMASKSYDYGTVMIPVQRQSLNPDEIHTLLSELARDSGVRIHGVQTGKTVGIDLGSREFDPIYPSKVGLLVGNGIRSYDAGEIWHLFDTRYDMKITKIDTDYLSRTDLSAYTDIIIPGFRGGGLSENTAEKLKEWVAEGGTLIGYRNVAQWLDKHEFLDLEFRRDTLTAENISFEQRGDFRGAQVTGGAIFEARADRSHPINFGYTNENIALFRNTNIYLEPESDSYNNPLQYTKNPLLSGYISEENAKKIAGSVPLKIGRQGRGRVILFTDNTNFRAFWYGTNKLLMNAVFFGHIM